jgi:hypothetical protein
VKFLRSVASFLALLAAFFLFLDWRGYQLEGAPNLIGIREASLCSEWTETGVSERKNFLSSHDLKTVEHLRYVDSLCQESPYMRVEQAMMIARDYVGGDRNKTG